MREPLVNPRFLFPAPGWKCFQCIVNGDTAEFWEQPIIGWGVVEGYDCEEGNELTEGSQMELLVALQEESTEAPTVIPASKLDDHFSNCAFGFLTSVQELTEEYKQQLEEKVYARRKRQEEFRKEQKEHTIAFVLKCMEKTTSVKYISAQTEQTQAKDRLMLRCSEEAVKKIITDAGFLLPQAA